MRKAERKGPNAERQPPSVKKSNPNQGSCDMVRVANRKDVQDGIPGSYCLESTRADGQQRMFLKLPGGGYCGGLPIARTKPALDEPSWGWDGNEDKPTLTPSVWFMKNSGRADEWHGWIRAGRMVSV